MKFLLLLTLSRSAVAAPFMWVHKKGKWATEPMVPETWKILNKQEQLDLELVRLYRHRGAHLHVLGKSDDGVWDRDVLSYLDGNGRVAHEDVPEKDRWKAFPWIPEGIETRAGEKAPELPGKSDDDSSEHHALNDILFTNFAFNLSFIYFYQNHPWLEHTGKEKSRALHQMQ